MSTIKFIISADLCESQPMLVLHSQSVGEGTCGTPQSATRTHTFGQHRYKKWMYKVSSQSWRLQFSVHYTLFKKPASYTAGQASHLRDSRHMRKIYNYPSSIRGSTYLCCSHLQSTEVVWATSDLLGKEKALGGPEQRQRAAHFCMWHWSVRSSSTWSLPETESHLPSNTHTLSAHMYPPLVS